MVRAWAGVLLGLILFILLMPIQAFLEGMDLSRKDDSFGHAFALVALILLSIIVLRRAPSSGGQHNRIIKPRQETER